MRSAVRRSERRLLCSEATLWPSETTESSCSASSSAFCRSATAFCSAARRPLSAPIRFSSSSCSRCEPVIASVRACTRTWCCFSSPCRRRAASSAVRSVRLRVRQVIIRLLQQALRLLLLSAELVQRGGSLLLLDLQTLDLVGARQDARTAGDGAARHGAACIQDLPVQRDDAEAVAELVGNGNGRVKVLRHNRAAEQIQDDLAIARLTRDKVGGYAAETRRSARCRSRSAAGRG